MKLRLSDLSFDEIRLINNYRLSSENGKRIILACAQSAADENKIKDISARKAAKAASPEGASSFT